MVKAGSNFDVANHDFTKFRVIPSIVLMNNIPPVITESWYRGKVYVVKNDLRDDKDHIKLVNSFSMLHTGSKKLQHQVVHFDRL